ncbi:DUF4303 domain-containing protein [Paenibacillus chitinolyticus]|uniref:DUF4303 domain-containing protein n=1 Tax=Paenibacillus chitinolyticus TaxID=79263 RepID=UPI0035578C7F
MEDALYEFCKSAMDDYAAEGNNKDVYTFSIYTDTAHGSFVIYINNLESLNRSVEKALDRDRQRYPDKWDANGNTAREQLYYEFKYAEADYPFMYDSMPQRLQNGCVFTPASAWNSPII